MVWEESTSCKMLHFLNIWFFQSKYQIYVPAVIIIIMKQFIHFTSAKWFLWSQFYWFPWKLLPVFCILYSNTSIVLSSFSYFCRIRSSWAILTIFFVARSIRRSDWRAVTDTALTSIFNLWSSIVLIHLCQIIVFIHMGQFSCWHTNWNDVI